MENYNIFLPLDLGNETLSWTDGERGYQSTTLGPILHDEGEEEEGEVMSNT